MKVPTYNKFGLSKREFENVSYRTRRISNLLTHDIPLILGIVIGMALWIYTYKRLNPSGFLETTSQIFIFGTIGLVCVGIPMLLFKAAERLYFAYIKRNSESYKGAEKYEDAREKYNYWKIRRDESYWKLLDGLSFENETLALLKKTGYTYKTDELDGTGIVSKDGEDFHIIFKTGMDQPKISEINLTNEKFIIVSTKPFEADFIKQVKNYSVKLISIKELTAMVRTIKE